MVPTAMNTAILIVLVSMVKENHAQAFSGTIEMIPDVTQQVIQSGSNITLTCIADSYLDDSGVDRISWQLPDNIVKYPVRNFYTLTFFLLLSSYFWLLCGSEMNRSTFW